MSRCWGWQRAHLDRFRNKWFPSHLYTNPPYLPPSQPAFHERERPRLFVLENEIVEDTRSRTRGSHLYTHPRNTHTRKNTQITNTHLKNVRPIRRVRWRVWTAASMWKLGIPVGESSFMEITWSWCNAYDPRWDLTSDRNQYINTYFHSLSILQNYSGTAKPTIKSLVSVSR